jgi:GT2 family glycosyltransferase
MIPHPEIAIVVVSYNTKSILLECIASIIESAQKIVVEIIVVDNDSKDGSPEAVRESYPHVQIIINSVNVGFGAACNQAIKATRSPFVLLLNSDARLTPESFNILYESIAFDERCGAASCRLLDDSGGEMVNTRNFLTSFNQALELTGMTKYFSSRHLSRTYRPHPKANNLDCSVDWIDGACMMLRRAALDEAGLFDEQFFMYSEDEDLCWRLRKHGWSICYAAQATAFHKGGASSTKEKRELLRHFYLSQMLFLNKYRGHISVRLYAAAMCAVIWLKRFFGSKKRTDMDERLAALKQASESVLSQVRDK